jgi:hypothetical protein
MSRKGWRQDDLARALRGHAALDFRHSRGNAHRRIEHGEVPVLCHACGTETDVPVPAHAPGCPVTPAAAVKPQPRAGTISRKNNRNVSSAKYAPDGSKTISQLDREEAAASDRQPMTVRCALCGWTLETTAARGRMWAAKHRERKHPELVKAKRRGFPKSGPTLRRERQAEERLEQTAARLEAM